MTDSMAEPVGGMEGIRQYLADAEPRAREQVASYARRNGLSQDEQEDLVQALLGDGVTPVGDLMGPIDR